MSVSYLQIFSPSCTAHHTPALPEPRIKPCCHSLIQFGGPAVLNPARGTRAAWLNSGPASRIISWLVWAELHFTGFLHVWCFLWHKARLFPDLLRWGAGPPAQGGAQQPLSPLTGLLYMSMMSSFTPCRVGWAHGEGFAQCRFRSNPIREHLHTDTHTQKNQRDLDGLQPLLGSAAELGSCSAAEVVKCYSHRGNKANAPQRKGCSNGTFQK